MAILEAPGATPTPPMLGCIELHQAFGGVPVLKGVGLSLERGTVTALAGRNGAGESTMIKIASVQLQANQGEVKVGGEHPHAWDTPTNVCRLGRPNEGRRTSRSTRELSRDGSRGVEREASADRAKVVPRLGVATALEELASIQDMTTSPPRLSSRPVLKPEPTTPNRTAHRPKEKEGHHMREIPSTMIASVLCGMEDLVLEERLFPSVRTVDELAVRGAA